MRGYKVFNPDWTCREFKFAVGKTYEEDVKPSCCNEGFHFCTELKDCFSYYSFDPDNKVAEIEALGDIDAKTGDSKCCTNKIKIVRELTWDEVLRLVNIGKGNTGFRNSGDWNSGDWNSGNYNSGNCNSGDWNKTNFSSGCFNTKESKILMFNKPSDWTLTDWYRSEARRLLDEIKPNVLNWIWSESMTDEEKEQHPEHKTTGGYLKRFDKSERGQNWWNNLTDDKKNIIKSLPNFDAEIFEEITGIHID